MIVVLINRELLVTMSYFQTKKLEDEVLMKSVFFVDVFDWHLPLCSVLTCKHLKWNVLVFMPCVCVCMYVWIKQGWRSLLGIESVEFGDLIFFFLWPIVWAVYYLASENHKLACCVISLGIRQRRKKQGWREGRECVSLDGALRGGEGKEDRMEKQLGEYQSNCQSTMKVQSWRFPLGEVATQKATLFSFS